jgi:4-amino-4-deoxy-L-arabinose transferase-like glycosyltransferase
VTSLPPSLARRAPLALFLLLTAIGVVRIAATYRPISQTSDETPNIACGMEWLNLGRYDYGPFHPPLARVAMAIGPYLYGARSQKLPDRWQEGNAVLGSAPRYGKALTLARIGILPFFVLACVCVWLWSRRLIGDWGALAPVFLFTNLPPVLAHAGLATSDMAVSAGVCAAVLAFVVWLDDRRWRNSLLLGGAMACAFLSKFSSVLLVPACFLVVLALRLPSRDREGGPGGSGARFWPAARAFAVALFTAALLVWAAYGFSWGRMSEHVADDAAGQSGFSKVPASFWHALERTPMPAPKILDGLWQVHNHADAGHAAYLLGHNSMRGWWYFFPVAIAVKTPLGALLLLAAGIFALARERLRKFDWRYWAPLASAVVILLVCMPATLNIGVRYMLPLYPMLAIVAGMGAVYLFRRRGRAWPAAAAVLMLWTAVSSLAAHPDYIAYFNEIAGSRPERILVDSDLDWGQDMNLLVKDLQKRRVPYIHLSCVYTGDDSRLALPAWDGLEPYQRVTGWVAVSFTKVKTYGWLVAQQRQRPDNGFAWLDRYQPVARVGKSILLYNIPAERQ